MTKEQIVLTVLITYIAGITVVGIWVGRNIKTTGEFLLAGRNVGIIVLTGSTLATVIGTGATIGATGYAYKHGFAGSLYGIGQALGILIVGLAFAKMRKYRFMSLGEEIACYYGGNRYIYEFANITMFLSLVCWIAVQIMGAANYLGILTGLSFFSCVILSGAGFAILTIIGGYVAVIYTDVVQAIIFSIGFASLTIFALIMVGGISALHQQVPAENLSFLGYKSVGWSRVIGLPLALMISYIAEPGYRHRIYSARSEKHAYRSMMITGLLIFPFALLVSYLGMSAYVLNPHLSNQDQTLPWLAKTIFPIWAMALIVVSGFAATFTSADSDAASGALFFIRHIYKLIMKSFPKNSLLVSRITIAVMMTAATLLVLQFKSIVPFIIVFISILGSGIASVIILGRFWRRATWQGAFSAIITGAAVTLSVEYISSQKDFWEEAIIPATLGAFIIHIVVSLMTAKDKIPFEVVAKNMEKERAELET